MKHVITLISALIFMSAAVKADDIKRNKKNEHRPIVNAPFVWGDPDEEAPAELGPLKVLESRVPVAPFVWGSDREIPQIVEEMKNYTSVPVAPFVSGDPDEEVFLDPQTSSSVQGIK